MRPLALKPWMYYLLRFAGTFNLLAGFSMMVFYSEGYKLLGMKKPELMMPVQLVGVLVALFGVGYHLTASNPIENRNVLALGWWSKALGSVLAIGYVLLGKLPFTFVPLVFFADIIYLPFFYLILRHIWKVRQR